MPRQPRKTVPLKTNGPNLPLNLMIYLGCGFDWFGDFTHKVEKPDPLGKRVIITDEMKDPQAMKQTYFSHRKEIFDFAEERRGIGSLPFAYKIFEAPKENKYAKHEYATRKAKR